MVTLVLKSPLCLLVWNFIVSTQKLVVETYIAGIKLLFIVSHQEKYLHIYCIFRTLLHCMFAQVSWEDLPGKRTFHKYNNNEVSLHYVSFCVFLLDLPEWILWDRYYSCRVFIYCLTCLTTCCASGFWLPKRTYQNRHTFEISLAYALACVFFRGQFLKKNSTNFESVGVVISMLQKIWARFQNFPLTR